MQAQASVGSRALHLVEITCAVQTLALRSHSCDTLDGRQRPPRTEKHGVNHNTEHHPNDHSEPSQARLATSATVHCLAGYGLGEVVGVVIGVALGLTSVATLVLAVILGFGLGSHWELSRCSERASACGGQ